MGSLAIYLQVKQLVEEVWKDNTKYVENYTLIINSMLKVLEQNPNDIIAMTNLGAAYCDLGKYDKAISVLKKAEHLGSDDKNTLFNIGIALINSASCIEAKKYFKLSQKLKASELTYQAYVDLMGY